MLFRRPKCLDFARTALEEIFLVKCVLNVKYLRYNKMFQMFKENHKKLIS